MKCPLCGAWTSQLETRKRINGLTYRRYECANMHRFTTEDNFVMRIDINKRKPGRPAKGMTND